MSGLKGMVYYGGFREIVHYIRKVIEASGELCFEGKEDLSF